MHKLILLVWLTTIYSSQ